jgi:hypothetical protein
VALLDLVRRDVQRLHDPSDGSGLNEFTGLDGGADFEPLAVHDAVDPFGLGLYATDFGQLFERGDAGLVGKIIFAVPHHANAERCAFDRNRRAEHELDGGIVEYLID